MFKGETVTVGKMGVNATDGAGRISKRGFIKLRLERLSPHH